MRDLNNLDKSEIIFKSGYHFERPMVIFGTILFGFAAFMFLWDYFVGDLFNHGYKKGEFLDLVFGLAGLVATVICLMIFRLEFFVKEKFIIVTNKGIYLKNLKAFSKLIFIDFSEINKILPFEDEFIRIYTSNSKWHTFEHKNFENRDHYFEFVKILKMKVSFS